MKTANYISASLSQSNLKALGKGVLCIAHPEVLAFSSCGLELEGKSLSTRRTKHVYELVLHTSVFHLKKDHAIFFTEVYVNFSVLVGVILGSLVKQPSGRAENQSYCLL